MSPEATSARLRAVLVDCGGSQRLLEGVEAILYGLADSWRQEAQNFSGEAQKRAVINHRAYREAARLVRQARVTLMQEMS